MRSPCRSGYEGECDATRRDRGYGQINRTIIRCSCGHRIVNNVAYKNGYGMYLGNTEGIVVINNIAVGNRGANITFCSKDSLAQSTFAYNCVWGHQADKNILAQGEKNMVADPLFADAENGDFHLRSSAGRWTAEGWATDRVTSPCIDAGDPVADYVNEPEPNGRRVNLGAYGNTPQASRSSSRAKE